MLEKIINFAKQLHRLKCSNNIEKCVEIAITQEIGNDALSKHLGALGITKQDYVAYIVEKMKNE